MNNKFINNRDIRGINKDVRDITDSLKRPNGVIIFKINWVLTESAEQEMVAINPFSMGAVDVREPYYEIHKVPVHLDAVIRYNHSDNYYSNEAGVSSNNADCFVAVKVKDAEHFNINDFIEIEGVRYKVVKKTPRGFRYSNRVVFDCRRVTDEIRPMETEVVTSEPQ
jgi:hypothetical protein